MRLAGGVLTACLAFQALPAASQEGQSRASLLTALAQNECAVAEDEVARTLGSQGFEGEFVRRELGQMVLDEVAFLEGGRTLRVFASYCPPTDPAPTPAQSFRSAIEENGCRIGEAKARSLGFSDAQLIPVVETWIARGEARIEDNALVLETCG